MDYKKILTGVLAKTLNIGDGEAAELIKDGENITEETITSSILDKDKERVKVLTNSKKEEHFQDGYKKAKKEERAKLEEEVKAEFGIESDKTGIDLIKDVVTAQSKSDGGKEGVTDEDIMKSKPYQDLLKTKKDELATQKTEFENQINTLKSEQMAEKNFAFVGKTAIEKLAGLNPVVSGNAEIASNIQNLFIKSITDKYDIVEKDGKTEVLGKDGKVAIDAHGNPLNYDELVKSHATKFYEFKANNGGSNAGNSGEGGSGGSGSGGAGYPANVQKPKTLEELNKLLNDESISAADRVTISETYNKESQGIV